MKILLLSPVPGLLMPALLGHETIVTMGPPTDWPEADWAVSLGYRHIIRKPTIEKFKSNGGNIINIHIGMLPYNRGADPNFWSFFDNTPKGVTVHQIDEGLDTGPIYDQCGMKFQDWHTLKSSYEALHRAASLHFTAIWPSILDGTRRPKAQPSQGTYHKSADKDVWMARLPLGWDTPVKTVRELGREARGQTITSVS